MPLKSSKNKNTTKLNKAKSVKRTKRGKGKKADGKTNESTWRHDFELKHQIIEKAYWDLVVEKKQIPTQQQIAERAGVARSTVQKHLEEINLDRLKPRYKHLTERVMMGLLDGAIEGKASNVKLWMQLVEGYVEKREVAGRDGNPLFPQNPYQDLGEDEIDAELERLRKTQGA